METGIVFVDKTTLSGDGTIKHPLSVVPVVPPPVPVDLLIFAPGAGTDAQDVFRVRFSRAVTFPAGAALSKATAKVAATASTTFTFSKNGAPFATVNFGIAGIEGVYTQAADAIFAAGDLFELDGPATADGTLADVGFTLAGTR